MVRTVSHRFVALITMLLVGFTPALLAGGTAQAAPARPNVIALTGEGLSAPLTVRADGNPALFTALLDQVSWLGGDGQTTAPKGADLGPKYTIVVLVDGTAKRTYDLYPQAKGGPRAFRPAKQPDGRRFDPAWFFGRLSMSETLRTAGVPLPAQRDSISGGIGGGDRVIPDEALNPGRHVDEMFSELRRLLLLNGAVLVAITAGLAGIALLVRRRTR